MENQITIKGKNKTVVISKEKDEAMKAWWNQYIKDNRDKNLIKVGNHYISHEKNEAMKAWLKQKKFEQGKLWENARIEKERLEKERLEKEKIKQEKINQQRLRLEKEEREKINQERIRLEQEERERINKERIRLEQEERERKRLEQEERERKRLEQEERERKRLEQEERERKRKRLEQEEIERKRLEEEKKPKFVRVGKWIITQERHEQMLELYNEIKKKKEKEKLIKIGNFYITQEKHEQMLEFFKKKKLIKVGNNYITQERHEQMKLWYKETLEKSKQENKVKIGNVEITESKNIEMANWWNAVIDEHKVNQDSIDSFIDSNSEDFKEDCNEYINNNIVSDILREAISLSLTSIALDRSSKGLQYLKNNNLTGNFSSVQEMSILSIALENNCLEKQNKVFSLLQDNGYYLFHKYLLGIESVSNNINYDLIYNNISKDFKNNKYYAHLHCYDISRFDEIYEKYIDKIGEYFSIIITYSIGDNSIQNKRFVVLKIPNKGMDIGGKFCAVKYLNDYNIQYDYILFLHSKSNPKTRKKYFEPLINNLDDEFIQNINGNNGYFPDIKWEIVGDKINWISNNPDFNNYKNKNFPERNNLYRNEFLRYCKATNNTNQFIEGNCYILSKKVVDKLYTNPLFYNILNTDSSFDYNWVINAYDIKGNIYKVYKQFTDKNLLPRNQTSFDGYFEHVFERVVLNFCDNYKILKETNAINLIGLKNLNVSIKDNLFLLKNYFNKLNKKSKIYIYDISEIKNINYNIKTIFCIQPFEMRSLVPFLSNFKIKPEILWVWEFKSLPQIFKYYEKYFSKVYLPSQFCYDIFSKHLSIPIEKVELKSMIHDYIDKIPDHKIKNQKINNILENTNNKTIYGFCFDLNSSILRKNPLNLVKAFNNLNDETKVLILKYRLPRGNSFFNNIENDIYNSFIIEVKKNKNIYCLTDELEPLDLYKLYTNFDYYISPHCGEGFGITIYDNMVLGNKIISPYYSGETEYLYREDIIELEYEEKQITGLREHPIYKDMKDLKGAYISVESIMRGLNNIIGDEIYILGNGPSLKNCDFNFLKNKTTFALNSSYKKFVELDFYPSYFGCFDPKLIECHYDKFVQLMNENNKIKKFFFLNENNKGQKQFSFQDENKSRYQKINFLPPQEKYINTSSFNKFYKMHNSGATATLISILLGYKKIILLGCDGNYVEQIPETRLIDASTKTLQILETPEKNPNYWFDNYQEKGEIYSVPDGNSCHMKGWELLYQASKIHNVQIINENLESKIPYFKKTKNNIDIELMNKDNLKKFIDSKFNKLNYYINKNIKFKTIYQSSLSKDYIHIPNHQLCNDNLIENRCKINDYKINMNKKILTFIIAIKNRNIRTNICLNYLVDAMKGYEELFDIIVVEEKSENLFIPNKSYNIKHIKIENRNRKFNLSLLRNIGIKQAKTKFVCMYDCDFLVKDISKLMKTLCYYYQDNNKLFRCSLYETHNIVREELEPYSYIWVYNIYILKEINYFNENFEGWGFEEVDLVSRQFSKNNNKLIHIFNDFLHLSHDNLSRDKIKLKNNENQFNKSILVPNNFYKVNFKLNNNLIIINYDSEITILNDINSIVYLPNCCDVILVGEDNFKCNVVGNIVSIPLDGKINNLYESIILLGFKKIPYYFNLDKCRNSIGIITPSLNPPINIYEEHLNYINNQQSKNYVHITIDSYSNNSAIYKFFEIDNPRSIYIKNKSKIVKAIQNGYELLSNNCEYWLWLNVDDFFYNEKTLSIVEEYVFKNKDIDIFYGNSIYKQYDTKEIKKAWINKNIEFNPIESFISHVGISQPSVYIKKNKLTENCIYNISESNCFDYELWIKFAFKKLKFKYINEDLSIYNFSDGNITSSLREIQLRQTCAIVKEYYKFVPISWIKRLSDYIYNKNDGIWKNDNNISFDKIRKVNKIYNYNINIDSLLKDKNLNNKYFIDLYNETQLSEYQEIKRAIILGNGPSLREIDLKSLSNYLTLGMNSAYRYWEKIDWYPDFYICCDLALYETHWKKINEFIKKNIFKKIILLPQFEKYNKNINNESNVFLINTDNIIKKYNFITTGSMGIYYFKEILGIDTIYISGIDCNYVDLINEAELKIREPGDITRKLIVKNSVDYNPNYFFNDYQQPNDIYHIPNKEMHIKSWEILYEKGIDIKNICMSSKLNIFKKEKLSDINYNNIEDIEKNNHNYLGKKVFSFLIIINDDSFNNHLFEIFEKLNYKKIIPVDFRIYLLENSNSPLITEQVIRYKKENLDNLNIVISNKYKNISKETLDYIKKYECATCNIKHFNTLNEIINFINNM